MSYNIQWFLDNMYSVTVRKHFFFLKTVEVQLGTNVEQIIDIGLGSKFKCKDATPIIKLGII